MHQEFRRSRMQRVEVRSADMCDRNMVSRECAKWAITLQCYQQYRQDIEQHPQPQQSFSRALKRARQLHPGSVTCAIQSHCFHNQQWSSEHAREQIRSISRRQTPHDFNNHKREDQNILRTVTHTSKPQIQHGFQTHAFLADRDIECPKQSQHWTGWGRSNSQQNANAQRF